MAAPTPTSGGAAALQAPQTSPQPPPPQAPQLQQLTAADLQRHIDAHGLRAELLPRPADLPDADVIKSLVFTANGRPVLVVAGLASKVDERKVAAHLGVSRRRVRLASTQDALLHSGYAVGTVPPFGERAGWRW